MKAIVAGFNQEKALVGAFSVITNIRMQLFEALDTLQITNWHYQCATVQLERSLHAVSAAATFTLCNVRILKYGAEHGAENTKMGTFYQGHRAKIS